MAIFLPGYAGTVWNAARDAISYANSNLSASNPQQSKTLARAVAATLKNASTALAVSTTYQGLQTVYANLASIIPLPLNLDSATFDFLNARVTALQNAALSLNSLMVAPGIADKQLPAGQPAVPDPQYLEWLTAFSFEAPPAGLSAANLITQAQTAATAWTTIANALKQKGVVFSGASYNTVVLMGNVSQVTANAVLNSAPSSSVSASQLWNQMVAMPSIIRAASAVVNDPTSQVTQDTAVIRYVLLSTLNQFNALIVSLRQVVTAQLNLGTVRQGDSLMTFAARTLNDYTAWRQIAQINGLQPPYIASTPGPNVAVPGQQLFLPSPNGSVTIAPLTAPVGSYINNYLGVDIFLGPLNTPMLTWTGDYQIVSGYDNLTLSLGRRMQTTLGNLIYHSLFGSRIPPEIGKIASDNELRLVEQYSISCLLSDPRVNKVVSCQATAGASYSIFIRAVVLPNGLGQEEVTVNEVIGPA